MTYKVHQNMQNNVAHRRLDASPSAHSTAGDNPRDGQPPLYPALERGEYLSIHIPHLIAVLQDASCVAQDHYTVPNLSNIIILEIFMNDATQDDQRGNQAKSDDTTRITTQYWWSEVQLTRARIMLYPISQTRYPRCGTFIYSKTTISRSSKLSN